MAGDYTRKEIDSLLASMKNDYINRDNALKNDYTSKINSLSSSLTSNYYTKAQAEKRFVLNHYQNGTLAMGWDGSEMHTFFNGSEIDGGGGGGGFPDLNKPISLYLQKSYHDNPGQIDTQYATIAFAGVSGFGISYYANTVRFKQATWCRRTIYSSGSHWTGSSDHGSSAITSGVFYSWAPFPKGRTFSIYSEIAGDIVGSSMHVEDVVCYPAK